MSFLTGFVTGLAGSIDKQVQASIERTRDNIDMVSKWRLKRAEEREKERKKKDEEIKTIIQDAAYTIGGSRTDVDAQNLAASLYKEQGLTGLTDTLNFIRKQKEKGISVNPMQYFTRANTDLPENKYTQSQIVRSFSDAESSYVSKVDMFPGEFKGSGIIKTLVPDFDVMSAGEAKATKQMGEIGFKTTETAPDLNFAKYTFDREGMAYATMSVNEKTSMLRDTINNTSSTPEQVNRARNRLDDLLNQSMTGEESSALNAINLKLSLLGTVDTKSMSEQDYAAHDQEMNDLIKRRDEIQDKVNLRDAKTTKERLLVEAEIARREGDIEKAVELTNKAQDQGGNVTFGTYKTRIESRMARNMNNDDYMNSTGQFEGNGYKEDIAHKNAVTSMENKSKDMNFDAAVSFKNNIQKDTLAEFKARHPDLFKELGLSKLAAEGDTSKFASNIMASLTALSADAANKYKDIQLEVIERYKMVGAKANVAPSTIEGAVMLLTGEGMSLTPDTVTVAGDVTGGYGGTKSGVTGYGDGDSDTLDPQRPANKPIVITDATRTVLQGEFPNTAAGAEAYYETAIKNGDSPDGILNITKQIHGEDSVFVKSINGKFVVNDSGAQSKAMQMLQDADALTSGNPFSTRDDVGVNRPKSRQVAEQLAQELNITVSDARLLIDKAVSERNAPLTFTADQLNNDNIAAALEREGFGDSYASLPLGRKRQAIDALAKVFGVDKNVIKESLDNYSEAGVADTPVEMTPVASDDSTKPKTDVTEMSNDELRQVISAQSSSNNEVIEATDELINRTRLSSGDDTNTVDKKPTTQKKSLVEKRQSAADKVSQQLKARTSTDSSLIKKYLNTPTELNQDEIAEIRRRLEVKSDFVDAMGAAIEAKKQNDATAAKRSKQQRTRIQGQGLMARGGLVG